MVHVKLRAGFRQRGSAAGLAKRRTQTPCPIHFAYGNNKREAHAIAQRF